MNEIAIVSAIQQYVTASPFVTSLAVFTARRLIFVFILFAVAFVFYPKKHYRHAAMEMGWALVIAVVLTAAIALLVKRGRPFMLPADPGHPIYALIPKPLKTAFPSGHAAASFAMAVAIWHANRRWGILAVAIAACIGLSRIAVGVHYPTDILGGAAVGIASFWIVKYFHEKLRTRDMNRAAERHTHA